MANKNTNSKDAGENSEALDAVKLRADVHAFAAQLGLTSGGGGGGFDASDFDASRAKQKLGSNKKAPQQLPRAVQGSNKIRGDESRQKGRSLNKEPRQQVAGEKRNREEPGGRAGAGAGRGRGGRGRGREHGGRGGRGQWQQEEKWKSDLKQRYESRDSGAAVRGGQGPSGTRHQDIPSGRDPPPAREAGPPAKSILGDAVSEVWYEAAAELPVLDASRQAPLDEFGLESCRQKAQEALDTEARAFDRTSGGRSRAELGWLQKVKTIGTTSDRIAALTLLLREAPLPNLRSLDDLLRLAAKTQRCQGCCGEGRRSPGRSAGRLPPGKEAKPYLLFFYFEDCIKQRYSQFLGLLEEGSKDNLEFVKDKCVKAAASLLQAKPEGEARLLAALVNKLGDPSRKLASKVAYLLSQLLAQHPRMKLVVTREVERFMFRPGLSPRALYYGIVFLNQLVLSHRPEDGGGALAQKLMDVYFTLFKQILEGRMGRAAEMAKEGAAAAVPAAGKRKDRWRRRGAGPAARGRGRGRARASGRGRRR
eukprot:jgi/Botrbrau1/16679/Bobra.0068s0095.1